MTAPVTPERTATILAYVRRFIAEHGYSPTAREICASLGISSTSVAMYHLNALWRQGKLERSPMKSRGLRVTGQRTVFPGDQVRVLVGGEVVVGELVSEAA